MRFERVYDFHDIPVGDTIEMDAPDQATVKRIRKAIFNFSERNDRHFTSRLKGDKLHVTRNR